MFLSIVIPVLNEESSLEELVRRVIAMADSAGMQCEIIFVDDGSSDTSWAVIRRLAASHSIVRGIRFRRNFGKAAALTAGIEAHKAQVVGSSRWTRIFRMIRMRFRSC